MENYKTYFFFTEYKRWVKKLTTFVDTEIEKRKFHHLRNLILSEDVDTEMMQLPSKVFPGKFISTKRF